MIEEIVIGYFLVINSHTLVIHGNGFDFGQFRVPPVPWKLVDDNRSVGYRLPRIPIHHEKVVPILSRRTGEDRQAGDSKIIFRRVSGGYFGRREEGQHIGSRLFYIDLQSSYPLEIRFLLW